MLSYTELIKNINILIADDDDDYLSMTYAFLTQIGYNVDMASDGKEALEKLNSKEYQILLLDYFMIEMNGEEVIKEIRKTNKELIIILQTGFSGQKPPIETMQKLNIQNYHDKTEGIDRLNLELISAVKIFNQQNEIELSNFKTNVLGSLMSGVAKQIKASLLSISAGIEFSNMIARSSSLENQEALNKLYLSNKETLEKLDKVLTAVIGQSSEKAENILSDKDIMDIIELVLTNQAKEHNVNLKTKIALKANSYINGHINDTIFTLCEYAKELIQLHDINTNLEIVLTEDENNWYFKVKSEYVNKMSISQIYLIKKVALSLENVKFYQNDNEAVFEIKKVIV